MSTSHKELEKQLKAPDPLQVRMAKLFNWMFRNSRLVTYVLVGAVAGGAAFFGWRYFQTSQRDARVEELGKVQVVYQNELVKANDERQAIMKKVEALEAKAAPAPAAKAGEATPPAPMPDPAVTAEKEALTKAAEAVKPNHDESRALFEAFAKAHPGKPEGWHAGVTAARLYAEAGKYAEARPLLETVLTNAKDSSFYQTQTRFTLIGVLEELGELDKALEETTALEKLADKELLPKVLLTRGRLQMLKNSKDDAKATFASLIENHGTTPEAQKARSMQALLN